MHDELSVLSLITARTDHRDAARILTDEGWTDCGAGDWAIGLRSPSGARAARISPFDPCAPYTARLYREAAATGQVPRLHAAIDLEGGGSLVVMEFLTAVAADDARQFLHEVATGSSELAEIVATIHAVAMRELPWCGPLDTNPDNVRRGTDGRLVVTDPYYADGPTLYGTILSDPVRVARSIPADRRRHILEIPLSASGGWDPVARERMRAALAMADRET